MSKNDHLMLRETIVGHGIDLVDIEDFTRLLNGLASGYLNLYFTPDELLAAGEGITKIQHLAGKFAVKEAVLKALGTGWGNGVMFTDIEIVKLTSGEPKVLLHRNLSKIMSQRQISDWLISISHTHSLAMARVIAIKTA